MPLPAQPVVDDDDRERQQRFEDTERELMAVLKAETTDAAARKRQLVGLFDRFRSEYSQLSVKLRESLRLQRRLMDKCLQMKNELVVCALKIKTTEQVQADEIKSLVFYRDECEYAWKQSALSQERERDAMRIIDELKFKIEDLQLQVKGFVVSGASATVTRHHPHNDGSGDLVLSTPALLSSKVQARRAETPLAVQIPTKSMLLSPSKRAKYLLAASQGGFAIPPLLTFDEWKSSTRVWSPATPLAFGGSSRTAATPSKAALYSTERQQEITRCVSVPSLQPTPMERVSSPQQQQRQKPATPTAALRTDTSTTRPQTQPVAQTSQSSPIVRRGGTPAIKRRAPRQLPHVQ